MRAEYNIRLANRRDLLRTLLGDPFSAQSSKVSVLSDLQQLGMEEVGLIYAGAEEAGMPSCMVVNGDSEREFFAWLSTYAPQFSPITQFCNVLRSHELRLLAEHGASYRTHAIRHAWAGLIVGECLALQASEQNLDLDKLSLTAAQSTFSFAVGRAECVWGDLDSRTAVLKRLQEMQLAGVLGSRPVSWSHLSLLWDFLLEGTNLLRTGIVGEALRLARSDLFETSALSANSIFGLQLAFRPAGLLLEMAERSAEERVALFDLLLKEFVSTKTEHEGYPVAAFALAYAAIRIGGGTTSHTDLLRPLKADHPLVWLWYGLIASLGPIMQWDRRFARTGRLIERELRFTADLLQPPHSDISWSELRSTMPGQVVAEYLRSIPRAQLRSLTVQVYPGVWLPISVGSREKPGESAPRADLTPSELERLDEALGILWETRQRLRGALLPDTSRDSPSGGSRQQKKAKRQKKRDESTPGSTKKLL